MSAVSAVPDDLDQDCLPELNNEEAPRSPVLSPPRRDLAASPASVPDDYDACVDAVPRVNEAGAAPPTDQGLDYIRESAQEERTASPVLGKGGHVVGLNPSTEQHAFPEGTETAEHHSGVSPGMAGAGVAGAGAGAAAMALLSGKRMPEERSMSAASMVAIKDGRTGVPGAVRTSNLECEPAPKTGDTFMTSESVTPSDTSLAGDTRRGNEAAESTASITAIRGGNEGAPPSPPGKSPLSASRTAEDVLDEAERDERERGPPGAGLGLGAAALGGAAGAGLVAAGGAARDTPEERADADTAEDLRASQLAAPQPTAPASEQPIDTAREIQSPSPRRDSDFHTATTSTPANESFATGTETTPADSTPVAGASTPHAPGDYMTAGSGNATATTPHAPGAFPVDPPAHEAAAASTNSHADVKEAPTDTKEPVVGGEVQPVSTTEAPEPISSEPAVAAPATTAERSSAAPAATAGAATAGVGGVAVSKAGALSTKTSELKSNGAETRSAERKPLPSVPAESSSGPSRTTGTGHSRTNSKSSAGSGRKVGFMSKLKGEIKVLSGKLKHDDKMVAEGERMKQGQ
jgi:hypothetical protein